MRLLTISLAGLAHWMRRARPERQRMPTASATQIRYKRIDYARDPIRIQSIEDEADALIELLEAPVAEQEKADGWSTATKMAFQEILRDTLQKKKRREDIPEVPFFGIGRGLDIAGVQGGDLALRIAGILVELLELEKPWRKRGFWRHSLVGVWTLSVSPNESAL